MRAPRRTAPAPHHLLSVSAASFGPRVAVRSDWQRAADAVTMGGVSSPAGTAAPKSLPLILARELASNLATPMFLIDADGMLVFYNDAAALLLGKSFAELGEIPAEEFGAVLELTTPDGEPMRRRDSPAGVALFETAARARRACSRPPTTGYDARTRRPRIRCSARPATCTA